LLGSKLLILNRKLSKSLLSGSSLVDALINEIQFEISRQAEEKLVCHNCLPRQ
jgi:hypothetical protein